MLLGLFGYNYVRDSRVSRKCVVCRACLRYTGGKPKRLGRGGCALFVSSKATSYIFFLLIFLIVLIHTLSSYFLSYEILDVNN